MQAETQTKTQQAVAYFKRGYNCAQAVAAAFAQENGLPAELAMRMHSGFGGGLCSGEVCGALIGAVSVIGLKYGSDDAGDEVAKRNCNVITQNYMERFSKKLPSINCRDLRTNREACVHLVADAADLLQEMGF